MTVQKERINKDITLLYRKEEDGIWLEGIDSRAAEVEIPRRIGETAIVGIYKKAFFNCRFLVSLKLPDSIKEIGDWAFAYCPKLMRVSLPRKEMKLGKSLFLGSEKLEEIELVMCGTAAEERPDSQAAGAGIADDVADPGADLADVSALLAAAITLLDADYLVSASEAGSEEWLRKWDSRLLEIISRSDQEGFTKQILCGEEDYGSTDLGLYETQRRREKVRLCFVRLLHPCGISEKTREVLTAYLLDHTCGCTTQEAWDAVRTEYAHKRRYYEFFMELGGITKENFDEALAGLGEQQPELKAYLMRFKEENLESMDFFDSLSLDF